MATDPLRIKAREAEPRLYERADEILEPRISKALHIQDFELDAMRRRSLRGLGLVRPWRLRRAAGSRARETGGLHD